MARLLKLRTLQSLPVTTSVSSASLLREFNAPAAWAALTTFIWYAVGMVPVQIAAAGHLGLDKAQISSWIFIIWFSGAVSSIALSVVYRQPLAITSSLPALVLLTSVANHFTFAELVGANMLAGLVTVGLGLLGIGKRLLVWLPMPLVMGMLGGSLLANVLRVVSSSTEDIVVSGATVAGYLLGRLWRHRQVPPTGVALVSGGVAALLAQRLTPSPVDWSLPTLVMPDIQFSVTAFVAVSLPLVLLSVAVGNLQGLGYLVEQGYRVPLNRVTVVIGVNTIVNAIFGGHTAQASRNGIPMVGGPEAGPASGRFWGSLLVAVAMMVIALAAEPVTSLLGILPAGYVATLAGLALVPTLQNALAKSFGGGLRFGSLVAFLVAATHFSALGITSAFWALPASVVASLLAERAELFAHWRAQQRSAGEQRRDDRQPAIIRPSRADRVAGNSRAALDISIRDLSASGLLVQSQQRLSPGDQLELAFRLPGGGAEMRLRVDVRHVEEAHDGPPTTWRAGCEFHDMDAHSAEQVARFILQQQPASASPQAARAALKLAA